MEFWCQKIFVGNMVSKGYVRNVVSKGYLLEMWCQTICWEIVSRKINRKDGVKQIYVCVYSVKKIFVGDVAKGYILEI